MAPKYTHTGGGSVMTAIPWPIHIEHKPIKLPYNKQQITDTFRSFDKNGDGKLSWDEVKAAFTKLGAYSPCFRAWRAKAIADTNDDGFICLNTELDELVNYTLKLQYTGQ